MWSWFLTARLFGTHFFSNKKLTRFFFDPRWEVVWKKISRILRPRIHRVIMGMRYFRSQKWNIEHPFWKIKWHFKQTILAWSVDPFFHLEIGISCNCKGYKELGPIVWVRFQWWFISYVRSARSMARAIRSYSSCGNMRRFSKVWMLPMQMIEAGKNLDFLAIWCGGFYSKIVVLHGTPKKWPYIR